MVFWNLYAFFYNKLNELSPYRKHIERVLGTLEFQDGLRYIDLGCGSGNLIQGRANIVGVDVSDTMLEIAKRKNKKSEFIKADLNKRLPFPENFFDGGYTSNVVAYLQNPKQFFEEVRRILKPGARFSVATLRPSFDPIKILKEDLKGRNHLYFFKNIFFISIILILNIPIVLKLKKNIYHGFEIKDLTQLVESCGFEVLGSDHTYAGQDVLLVLKRN